MKYLKISEFAELTGKGRNTIVELIRCGKIPAANMKTESSTRDRFLIPEDALEQMAAREAEERRNAVESKRREAKSNRRRNANANNDRPSEFKWFSD